MKYRKASVKDIDGLYEIEANHFSHPWTKEQFLYEISENEFSTILVAEEVDKFVGFLVYWILFDNAQICYICVRDEYRKKGIASDYLILLKRRFKCMNASQLL